MPLLWAFFIACSWTWVIGMYLPVLLIRDFGVWGWIVFAVPNVLGAGALAWVLTDADASRRFVSRHGGAVVAFGVVTVLFQLVTVGWLGGRLFGPVAGLAVVAAVALVAAVAYPLRLGTDWAARAAVAVWLVSAGVLLVLVVTGTAEFPASAGREPRWHLSGLLPATVLGFLLCPYLDATFHEARQKTSPAGGRVAFGVGFGVLFLVMIGMSLLYARALPVVLGGGGDAAVRVALATHLTMQVLFTTVVHLRAIAVLSAQVQVPPVRGLNLLAAGALPAAGVLGVGLSLTPSPAWLPYTPGETAYRSFMGFYGLLFPAYVLLTAAVGLPAKITWLAAAAALPFFAAGFLLRMMPWTLGGIAILLLAAVAGLLLRRRDPEPADAVASGADSVASGADSVASGADSA